MKRKNKGYWLPILGLAVATGYGVFEMFNHNYERADAIPPILPNGQYNEYLDDNATLLVEHNPIDTKELDASHKRSTRSVDDKPPSPTPEVVAPKPEQQDEPIVEQVQEPDKHKSTDTAQEPQPVNLEAQQPTPIVLPEPIPQPEPQPQPQPEPATEITPTDLPKPPEPVPPAPPNVPVQAKPSPMPDPAKVPDESQSNPVTVHKSASPTVSSSSGKKSEKASSNNKKSVDAAPTVTKAANPYEIDEGYFKGLGKRSMGYRFKDYLLMSPAHSRIGNERAAEMKKVAEKEQVTIRGKKVWFTHWYAYQPLERITGEFLHRMCKHDVAYNEGTTYFSIGSADKSYFDFLWKWCGRPDKSKPKGGWYA